MKKSSGSFWLLGAIVFGLGMLSGCNALNPFCGSARPAPKIASLSETVVTLAQVQQGFVLTVTGSRFVASSVVVLDGVTLNTIVTSSSELQVTINNDVVSGAGTVSLAVKTPSGNSGNLGCTSGGTSAALPLTIT